MVRRVLTRCQPLCTVCLTDKERYPTLPVRKDHLHAVTESQREVYLPRV
jgi:hypothetical protein